MKKNNLLPNLLKWMQEKISRYKKDLEKFQGLGVLFKSVILRKTQLLSIRIVERVHLHHLRLHLLYNIYMPFRC